jgi:hypothetical protein
VAEKNKQEFRAKMDERLREEQAELMRARGLSIAEE